MPPKILTVFHDGSCPLCRLEIEHYRRQRGADRIAFVDVTDPASSTGDDLGRRDAMARFHVRRADGAVLVGAPAFVAVWEQLPRWRWAARLARLPRAMCILDMAYTLFLPVRPLLAGLVGRFVRV